MNTSGVAHMLRAKDVDRLFSYGTPSGTAAQCKTAIKREYDRYQQVLEQRLAPLAFDGARALRCVTSLEAFTCDQLARSRTGQLLPFRPGIGFLLARFPRPVVPVSIRGTFAALPPGRWWVRPGPVTVTFGPALEPRRLVTPEMSHEEAARQIVHALQTAVADLGRG